MHYDHRDIHFTDKYKLPATKAKFDNLHFKELLQSFCLIDTFRHINPSTVAYSFFDRRCNSKVRNKGWRLDFILVPQTYSSKLIEASIMREVEGSDHVPCIAILQLG
mmetsp:Transcript_16038/g.29390  ORF Transcript_16038/g.29390 Transcript_16038/m.29390 type:complete len:107 (-) Transcript_16038:22-342(-)